MLKFQTALKQGQDSRKISKVKIFLTFFLFCDFTGKFFLTGFFFQTLFSACRQTLYNIH